MSIPVEPPADLRQVASGLWQLYNALINEGFDERKALALVAQVIATGNSGK